MTNIFPGIILRRKGSSSVKHKPDPLKDTFWIKKKCLFIIKVWRVSPDESRPTFGCLWCSFTALALKLTPFIFSRPY